MRLMNHRPAERQTEFGGCEDRRDCLPNPWSVASVVVLCFCLWLAWQPAAETSISSAATAEPSVTNAAESSFVPAQKPIIEISVGHAVRTDEARGDHDDAFGSKVDAATWKHLVLKCRKVDGSTADVELLRPASWLTDQQAEVGGTIEVSVPECGIEGRADVLAINDCPKLQPTPEGYRTVTGTFRHESAEILDITVEGQPDPIGTTAVHPFWSEDRQDYVRADELKVGEHLLGDTGQIEITSISTRGSPEPVYNLEVFGDHNYKVSTASLLVHNGNTCKNPWNTFLHNNRGKYRGRTWYKRAQQDYARTRKSIRSIDNTIRDHMKPGPKGDIRGTVSDMTGNPIPDPRPDGKRFYDHVDEAKTTMRGLRNHIKRLEGVTDPDATAARKRAQDAIAEFEDALRGIGI